MGSYAVHCVNPDSDTRQLCSMLNGQTTKVEALQMLIDEQASSREKDTEIAELRDLQAKEKQCVKNIGMKHVNYY